MPNSLRTIINSLFIGVVGVLLVLPLITWLAGVPAAGVVQEKRNKLTWASVSQGNVMEWPQRFERFFNDNFGLRDQLVSGYNQLDYALLRSNAKVLIGSDGWLFLERGLNADMPPIVDDLCGRLPFSESAINHWQQQLSENWQRLRAHDRQYLLTIVPNKHTLYRHYLPGHLQCPPATTRLMALQTRLNADSDFPYLDLFPALKTASTSVPPVYHQTDTHWNRVGVYIAYRHILEAINENRAPTLPAIRSVVDTDRVVSVSKRSTRGDLAVMLGLGDTVSEVMEGFKIRRSMAKLRRNPLPGHSEDPYRQPVAFVNPSRESLPRILVFHDSFIGSRVQLLLAETFSHATFVWNSGPHIPFDVVDKVQPDIVIHEMVERSLLQPVREPKTD